MPQVFTFVMALLPIATVFLLLVVLARSAKLSMGVAYLVTAATALLVWGTDLNKILGATVNGAVTAVSLLYIIFGAILMLYTLEESGGIRSIPKGQTEAALALGMSHRQTLRRIIIPQATRLVLPPMTNDFIALFKDTAVCSVITVVELSKMYYIQARSAGAIVELGLLTALLYLAMSYPLAVVTNRLEQNLTRAQRA